MDETLLDETLRAQLHVEWERFRKVLSQAGDIGDLKIEDLRILPERDRRGVPPAVSIPALQAVAKLEKSGLRGQAIRGGEDSKDPTLRTVAQAQAGEVRLQDSDHGELYGALAYYAGKRLGLQDQHALIFGDAVAYLLTGWGQSHTDGRYIDRLVMEFKKQAGAPPEGGMLWTQLHSLMSRSAFRTMIEKARQIGTAMFR